VGTLVFCIERRWVVALAFGVASVALMGRHLALYVVDNGGDGCGFIYDDRLD
jgi:hypothetical protein